MTRDMVRRVSVKLRSAQVCHRCGKKLEVHTIAVHEKGIESHSWVSRYLCIGCSEEIGVDR